MRDGIMAEWSGRWARLRRRVDVPDLVGLSYREGLRALQRLGLAPEVRYRRPSAHQGHGAVVVAQVPAAGVRVRPASCVRIVLGFPHDERRR